MAGEKKQRLVSLHGFFAFDYPGHWKEEPGEEGHFVLFDPVAGSGVLRVMTGENEIEGQDPVAGFYSDVLETQKEFGAEDLLMGENRFVHYVQVHDLNGTLFSVYHWVTVSGSRILLFAYTVQTLMKDLPVAEKERSDIRELLGSLQFLHGHADHG